jgi:hypothetical protein
VTGRWFSPGTPVSSTNKTDCHDIIEILLKVALDTINQAKSDLTCDRQLARKSLARKSHLFSKLQIQELIIQLQMYISTKITPFIKVAK